jgi:putative ABC transport system permease protein
MRSLASLGPRSVRRDAGRYALTAIGIALGVGVVFGILLTNESVNRSFDRQFAPSAPGLVYLLPSGAFGADLPAETVSRAASLPGVASANGSLGFWSAVGTEGGRDQFYVSADVSQRGSAPPRDLNARARSHLEGREPSPGANEVVVGRSVARALHARVGAPVTLQTPTGARPFVVTGIRVFNDPKAGEFVEATMASVQRATGKGAVVSSVSVQLGRGVDRTQWTADHSQDFGPGIRLASPNQGLVDLRRLYDAVRGSFAGLASVAMFVGAFLVFLTLSMAVVERTRLYGTVRALGASRGQVLRAVLGEALALGALSTAAGLVLGLAVGAGFLSFVSRVYGVGRTSLAVPPTAVVEAVAIGIATTTAASLVPALRASRLSPVEAIRGSYAQDRRLSRAWMAGAALLAAGVTCSTLPGRLRQAGSPLVLLGAVLLVPLITRPVASLAGRVTRRLAPGVGDIGVMHLVKERSRSGYTLALVMVVLALVLATGAIHRSFRATQELGLRRLYPADLAVYGGQRMSAEFISSVRDTRGVKALTALRFGETAVGGPGGTQVFLSVIDPDSFFAVQPLPWVAGTDASVRRALQGGRAAVLPQGLARRFGVGMGGHLTLSTSQGPRTFVVAGIYPTSDSFKTVTVGLPDGRRYFNAGDANALAVLVDPGAEPRAVGNAIQARLGTHGLGSAFVRISSADKARARKGLNDYFRLVYAVLLVAGTMGLLGMGNTLAVSVVRRTREIGVLRAVGTHRRQVWGLVLVESATLALVALALALPLGWLLSVTILRSTLATLGVVVAYRQPWPLVPVIGALALATAAASAVAPARRAARIEPVTALRFE